MPKNVTLAPAPGESQQHRTQRSYTTSLTQTTILHRWRRTICVEAHPPREVLQTREEPRPVVVYPAITARRRTFRRRNQAELQRQKVLVAAHIEYRDTNRSVIACRWIDVDLRNEQSCGCNFPGEGSIEEIQIPLMRCKSSNSY